MQQHVGTKLESALAGAEHAAGAAAGGCVRRRNRMRGGRGRDAWRHETGCASKTGMRPGRNRDACQESALA